MSASSNPLTMLPKFDEFVAKEHRKEFHETLRIYTVMCKVEFRLTQMKQAEGEFVDGTGDSSLICAIKNLPEPYRVDMLTKYALALARSKNGQPPVWTEEFGNGQTKH